MTSAIHVESEPSVIWKLVVSSQYSCSSVCRALHRYRRGHGFKSRSGLSFFQALISILQSLPFVIFVVGVEIFFLRKSPLLKHLKTFLFQTSQFACTRVLQLKINMFEEISVITLRIPIDCFSRSKYG